VAENQKSDKIEKKSKIYQKNVEKVLTYF